MTDNQANPTHTPMPDLTDDERWQLDLEQARTAWSYDTPAPGGQEAVLDKARREHYMLMAEVVTDMGPPEDGATDPAYMLATWLVQYEAALEQAQDKLRAAHEREARYKTALEHIREYEREQNQQDREFGVLGPDEVGYVFGLADQALAATTTPSTAAGEGGQGEEGN